MVYKLFLIKFKLSELLVNLKLLNWVGQPLITLGKESLSVKSFNLEIGVDR